MASFVSVYTLFYCLRSTDLVKHLLWKLISFYFIIIIIIIIIILKKVLFVIVTILFLFNFFLGEKHFIFGFKRIGNISSHSLRADIVISLGKCWYYIFSEDWADKSSWTRNGNMQKQPRKMFYKICS